MPSEMSESFTNSQRWLIAFLVLVGILFFGLHFVHLTADFPNHSPWVDGAKTTDEGWYGGAAAHHFMMGSWYLPGSFNPAVSLPVWPVILGVWFQVTGVSMTAARVLMLLFYGVSLGLMCLLVKKYSPGAAWAAALVLMVVNPYCYVFDRMALLEPMLVFWLMVGIWLADTTGLAATGRQMLLGVVIVLMVLTKTTGAFLVPAVLYPMWAVAGFPKLRRMVRPVAVVMGTAVVLWVAYFVIAVRPHYMADYKLLLMANRNRVYLAGIPYTAYRVMLGSYTMDPYLFPAACCVLALSVGMLWRLWRNPLFGAATLGMLGYMAFILYHSKLYEGRYYLVISIPVAVLVVMGINELLAVKRLWGGIAAGIIGFAAVLMAAQTAGYALRPTWDFVSANKEIAAKMRADRTVPLMLLSDSGDDVTFFTGVPAVAWEFHTDDLSAVLDRYNPGWYAAWDPEEDAVKAKLQRRYRLVEVSRYRIFDLPLKDWMILYRLEPIGGRVQR
jgi:4-amino-4-deoxy-L-arabinose transferase-like glycosyltransferase